MDIREKLGGFFAGEKIERWEVLQMDDCVVINEELLKNSIPNCQCVILYALPYFTGVPGKRNLSLYALSRDYHICLKAVNARLIAFLSDLLPDEHFVGFGDHSPLSERAACARAGLGVRGDNGLLITEEYGSYVFLGEVLTTAAPETLGAKAGGEIGECLHCGACKTACPTGFDGCASYYSQKKGELTDAEREAIRKTGLIWGCDLCQTCCPLNKNVKTTPIDFFREDRIDVLDGETLENMDKKAFRARAFSWHGKAPLRRNIALYEEKNGEKKHDET